MGSYTTVELNGQLYQAQDWIDKNLKALGNVALYRYTTTAPYELEKVYTAKKGESLGTVWSYIEPSNHPGMVLWQFKDGNGKFYFIIHDSKLVGGDAESYGVKSLKEKEEEKKEEEEKPSLWEEAQGGFKKLAVGGAVVFLLSKVITGYFSGKK